MLVLCAFAAALLGAQPQCVPDVRGCYHGFDVDFGDAYAALSAGAESVYTPAVADTLCTRRHWNARERCHEQCPLRLQLSTPLQYNGTTFCLQASEFRPFVEAARVDMHHDLNNRDVVIMPVGPQGTPSRFACVDEAFADKSYKGAVVISLRGGCRNQDKFVAAQRAGARAGIMVNSDMFETDLEQLITMEGDLSEVLSMPAMAMTRQDGIALFDVLDAAPQVTGKIIFACNTNTGATDDTALPLHCPDTRLRNICMAQETPEQRLCAQCAVALTLPGVAPAQRVCLWENELKPFNDRTSLAASVSLPYTFESGAVVYVPPGVMRREGCSQSDWAGLARKTVILEFPGRCVGFELVRAAEAQGVAGVVFLSPRSSAGAQLLIGSSRFVSIPVHTVAPEDCEAVVSAALAAGAPTAGLFSGGYALAGATVDVGDVLSEGQSAARPSLWEPTLREGAPRDHTLHTVETTVVMIVIIVLLLACLVRMLYYQYAHIIDPEVLEEFEDFDRLTAQNPIAAPAGDDGGVRKKGGELLVPLGIAATSVSFVLLAVVTFATLLLAYHAGKDATLAAMAHGVSAEEDSTEASLAGVESAGQVMRAATAGRITLGTEDLLYNVKQSAMTAAGLFVRMPNDRWESFAEQLPYFTEFTAPHTLRWISNIFTSNGFFASNEYRTDDRPSFVRNDNVSAPVAFTNNGFPYGVNRYVYVPAVKRTVFWYNIARYQHDVFNMLGSGIGRPLELLPEMSDGETRWVLPERSWPGLFSLGIESPGGYPADSFSVSAFVPIVNYRFQRLGVAEARLPLRELQQLLDSATQPGTQRENATLVLFDLAGDRRVLASNRWSWPASLGQFQEVYSPVDLQGLHTLDRIPVVELNALDEILDRKNIGVYTANPILSTNFNQREYFRASPDRTVLSLSIDQLIGDVVDYGSDGWEAEIHGTSATIVARDADSGRRVMTFTGSEVLRIYQNLTTDTPHVARTRQESSVPGNWNSSNPYFQQGVRELPSGRFCPLHRFSLSAGVTVEECVLREHIFDKPFSVSLRVKPAEDAPAGGYVSSETTVLFSDTPEGDANIRLYANGAMAVGLLDYGCYTNGVGMSRGVWYSITAVVDFANLRCQVYKDGELATSSDLAATFRPTPKGRAWVVGQRFKGSIDHVAIHRIAVRPREALLLHTRMTQRESSSIALGLYIDNKDWYVDALRVSRATGLEWASAVLVSRDDVLRWVEASHQRALEALDVVEYNGLRDLRRRINDVGFIATGLVLACLVILLLFTEIFVAQFANVACTMCEVAIMDVEESQIPKTSLLRELNTLNRATRVMLRQLLEYRSFLPQSLLVESATDARKPNEEVLSDAQEVLSNASSSHSESPKSCCTPDKGSHRGDATQAPDTRTKLIDSPGLASKSPELGAVATPLALRPKGSNYMSEPSRTPRSPGVKKPMKSSFRKAEPSLTLDTGLAARRGIRSVSIDDTEEIFGAPVFSPTASEKGRRGSALFSPSNTRLQQPTSPTLTLRRDASRLNRRMSHLFSPTQRRKSAGPTPSYHAASWADMSMAGREQALGSLLGDSRFAVRLKRVVVQRLMPRKVTYLIVNVCDWHSITQDLSSADVVDLHGSILARVATVFASERGVMELFQGDRFACSFNAYDDQLLASHRTAACKAALAVKETLGNSHEHLRISCSIVSGTVRIGNFGAFFMKRNSFISPTISWAHALERYARLRSIAILTDHTVYEEAAAHIFHRLVGVVKYAKLPCQEVVVAEVMQERITPASSTWMFTSALGDEHPYRTWNELLQAVFQGFFEEARSLVDTVKGDDLPIEEVGEIRTAVQRGSYTPYLVLLH